jgi:hypothetical protein
MGHVVVAIGNWAPQRLCLLIHDCFNNHSLTLSTPCQRGDNDNDNDKITNAS